MADWRWLDTRGMGTRIDLADFRFGGDRLRNPAIVVPNRIRRWFHDWTPGVDLIGKPHWPGRMLTVDLPDPLALYFHADGTIFTGIWNVSSSAAGELVSK